MATDTPSPESVKQLEEIRREVVEARNMTIKTDNALKSLHAELKTVSQTQLDFQRRSWFSSAVVYIAFVAVCGGAAILLSNVKASNVAGDKDRLDKQVADLNAQLDKQKAEAAVAAASERQATDVYRMMTTLQGDERLKGIDALGKIDQTKLTPFMRQVLHDRAILLRKEVGSGVLERGKAAFRKSDWADTIEQLNRFLALNPVDEDAIEASYYLGNAYLQSRKFEDAVKFLTRFIDGDKRAKNRDYAMLMLSQAYDALGNRDKAVEVTKDALTAYPASEFRVYFLQRLQRPATPAAAQPTTAAPATTPPAPQKPATQPPAPAPAKPVQPAR